MKHLLMLAEEFLFRMINTLYRLLPPYHPNSLELNTWARIYKGKLLKRNFGDELNIYMLKELTGRHISIYKDYFHFKKKNYLVIGSLIEQFTDSNTIVWGSGAIIGGTFSLKDRPAQVCAVRGRLTREYLIRNGVNCPEVYGDPALLISSVYKPSVEKKWKVGIIPHVNDINDPVVSDFLQKYNFIHLISFKEYNDWHSVIDEINECEFILSSSLHGLILSDAYGIPNVWIKISDRIIGGSFKYLDYFSGVDRKTLEPVCLQKIDNLSKFIDSMIHQYEPIRFDRQKFIEACPFEINITA